MASPTDPARSLVLCAALLGGTGVALGAFATHALEPRLTAEMLEIVHTGTRYQVIHALALLALAGVPDSTISARRRLTIGRWWVGGALLFSLTLYLIPLTGRTMFGAVTPIGGVALLIGWGWLVREALRR